MSGADATQIDGVPVVDGTEEGSEPVLTRGLNARAMLAWVRRWRSDAAVADVARALSARALAELGGAPLRPRSLAWVGFFSNAELLVAVDRVCGAGDGALFRPIGQFMAEHDFPTIARPMARLITPGVLIAMATRIWRMYYTHGRWEVVRAHRLVEATLRECPAQHAAICEGNMGWMEGVLQLAGAMDVVVSEEACVARGDAACSFRLAWREGGDAAAVDPADRTLVDLR